MNARFVHAIPAKQRIFDAVVVALVYGATGIFTAPLVAAAATAHYKLTFLPSLGGSSVAVNAINYAGDAVGCASTTGEAATHAALWHAGKVIDLGTVTGDFSCANAINSGGTIVGISTNEYRSSNAVIWKGSAPPTELPTPYWFFPNAFLVGYSATAINGSEEIAGNFQVDVGDISPSHFYFGSAVWGPNSTGQPDLTLNSLGGEFSCDPTFCDLPTLVATAINDRGQTVGFSVVGISNSFHAAFWNRGRSNAINLGTLGGASSAAFGINVSGVIVGSAETPNGVFQAARWRSAATKAERLPGLGGVYRPMFGAPDPLYGPTSSWANAINSSGQIVGYAYTVAGAVSATSHAVLWEAGHVVDLNDYLPQSDADWILTDATAINNDGSIVGSAFNPRLVLWSAYLLKP